MHKDRKVEDGIGSKMVQANPKVIEKPMKEGGSRKAKTGTDERDEKNDLTRTWSRNPVLARNSPFSNVFALDQAVADELAELVFGCCWSWPNLLSSPHGHKLSVLDQRKG